MTQNPYLVFSAKYGVVRDVADRVLRFKTEQAAMDLKRALEYSSDHDYYVVLDRSVCGMSLSAQVYEQRCKQ